MEQNKTCRNGAKGRERHVVSPVTKWYDNSESDGYNEEIISKENANNIISRARVMMNLATEVFKKTKAPIMSNKSNWLDHVSSLLLTTVAHNYGFK